MGKAIAAQKKTFHMRLELQKLVPSSRLINVPPENLKIYKVPSEKGHYILNLYPDNGQITLSENVTKPNFDGSIPYLSV